MPIRKYLGRIEPVSLKRTDGSIAVVFAEVWASDDRLVIEVGNTDGEMSIPQHEVRKLAGYARDVLDGIGRFRAGDLVTSDFMGIVVTGTVARIQRPSSASPLNVVIDVGGEEHIRAISEVELVRAAEAEALEA